jgi:hypothetical protein
VIWNPTGWCAVLLVKILCFVPDMAEKASVVTEDAAIIVLVLAAIAAAVWGTRR